MYKVVCVDERAAQPEYDVVKDGDIPHRPVATFYKKYEAAVWALYLNGKLKLTTE
jgi:hypothetical protein